MIVKKFGSIKYICVLGVFEGPNLSLEICGHAFKLTCLGMWCLQGMCFEFVSLLFWLIAKKVERSKWWLAPGRRKVLGAEML